MFAGVAQSKGQIEIFSVISQALFFSHLGVKQCNLLRGVGLLQSYLIINTEFTGIKIFRGKELE
jgi:hypothetical protein